MEKMLNNKKVIVIIACIVIIMIGLIILIIEKNKQNDEIDFVSRGNDNVISNIKSDDYKNEDDEYIFVHIVGEVNNKGVVRLKQGARIVDAIDAAGGATEQANLEKINLAFVLSDGQKLCVPSINDSVENKINSYLSTESGESVILNGENSESIVFNKINVNTATQTELETLPGIGPSLANNIIIYRKKYGIFKNINDLKCVSGIGEAKFALIKDKVCVK